MHGQNTPNGFLPNTPGVDQLMDMINKKSGGWDEINNRPAGEALRSADDEMAQNYAKAFSTPAGQKVLEDILSMTLHRSPYPPNENAQLTLEQIAAYGVERKGQNGLAISILAKITRGQNQAK